MLNSIDYLLICPDWGIPVSYSRLWRTAIQNTITGTEKRSALYTWPRRTLSYVLQTTNATESNYIKKKIFKNLQNIWGIPFWQDRTTLSIQADAGQTILDVESTGNRNFEIGAPCIIRKSDTSYEIGEIFELTATQITLKDSLNNTWAVGTNVYPVMQARLQPAQNLNMTTAGIGDIKIEAKEVFDSSIIRYVGDASNFNIYKELPVFEFEPNFADNIVQSFSHPYQLLQFLGSECLYSNIFETKLKISAKFFEIEKTSIWNVLTFFDAMMGRYGHFWFPSWQSDIFVTGPIEASDTELTIEDIDYLAATEIYILFPDGTGVCRTIIDHPSNTIITLDAPVGNVCPVDKLGSLLVSFLYLVRFDADEIKTEYITENLGEINIQTKTIYEL